jgi:hypothetical protein
MSEYRFAIGQINGVQSNSWKFWTQGNEAYLLQRGVGAKYQKFSFHQSGNCRWAQIAPGRSGTDRAIHEWTRDPVPAKGSSQACFLLSIIFPTNHLSAPLLLPGRPLNWISPAPPGEAVEVEILLTQEPRDAVSSLFGADIGRKLASFHTLRNGLNFCIATSTVQCGPVEITVPGSPVKPGQVFGDLIFPDIDTDGTGRPVRMVMIPNMSNPPILWELGGHAPAKK